MPRTSAPSSAARARPARTAPGGIATQQSLPGILDPPAPAIRIGRGPQVVEHDLFARVQALLDAAARDPALLATQVRVVVPSRSLREHVLRSLVLLRGRAAAGIVVQTLYAVAREILDRAGTRVRPGRRVFPILVRQQAQREPALRDHLDDLRDGYAVVAETVADLLDAGLETGHVDRLVRALGRGEGARPLAAAVVRVAGAVRRGLRDARVHRDADLFVLATGALARNPDALLPSRAVFVHGFADATGAATQLIGALQRHRAAEVLLDAPPDPVAPERPDVGNSFSERFQRELARGAAPIDIPAAPPARTGLALYSAPGSDAEVRAVARRIHTLLADGTAPESIGLVARSLTPYSVSIRTQLRRLAIPFSGLSATGPRGPDGRRVLALLELLRRRDGAATDTWIDALGPLGVPARGEDRGVRGTRLTDLRIGLHAAGAGRVRDVASLDLEHLLGERDTMPLPVRRGIELVPDDAPGAGTAYAQRRTLHRKVIAAAVDAAQNLVRAWDDWPADAPFHEHLGALGRLLDTELGWQRETTDASVASLVEQAPADFRLDRDDFVSFLHSALADDGRVPLGGAGGGVQVLDVTEARGRTFEHLFVVGCNRDAFPRVITEDPLLTDAERTTLRDTLPVIPIKRAGYAEERYLFAQLLASAANVTLSWQSADDEGRARSPSPLVERVQLEGSTAEPETVVSLFGPPRGNGTPRPAHEHAVLAGLYGAPAAFARALDYAFEERAGWLADESDPQRLARARLAILREFDPTQAARSELGPYYGYTGPITEAADPRRRDLFVTAAEGIARCPWQTLVGNLLRIEPAPDALGSLPGLDPRLVGSIVHAVLEQIVRDAIDPAPGSVAEALRADPVAVPWPEPDRLDGILDTVCRDALVGEGIGLPGFARALAARARPYLEAARERDWARPVGALGVEVTGVAQIELDGRAIAIHFKADRVDRDGDRIRVTDYKTGAPPHKEKKLETRHAKLLRDVAQGVRLQAVAYQLGTDPENADGRYLFLRPDTADHAFEAVSPAGDAAFVGAFRSAVREIDALRTAGSFFPRLTDPQGSAPRPCDWCDVREACLWGDSGARARLRDWTAARTDGSALPSGTADAALLGVWKLPAADPAGGAG